MSGTPANSLNISGNGIVTSDLGVISTSTVTQYGTLVAGVNQTVTSLSPGTAGQILVSNGPTENPSFQTVSASGITQIDGDTGSATGSSVTLTTNHLVNGSGGSFLFSASSNTITLQVTSANGNTFFGDTSGNSGASGSNNSSFGKDSLSNISTGITNVSVGFNSLAKVNTGSGNCALGVSAGTGSGVGLTSGSNNILVGNLSGSEFLSSESNNIYLNNSGFSSESNTLRIGQNTGTGNQELNKAFIHGIAGNTVSNQQFVTIDSTTSELGSVSSPPGSGFTSIVVQTFTSSGTYTPTSGMSYCTVECVGGGGGGATAATTTGTQVSVGGGGGGGEYVRKTFALSSVTPSQVITIGSGGSADNDGTDTTFGSLLTAHHGSAGLSAGASSGTYGLGGAGGIAGTGGDIHVAGGSGVTGIGLYEAGGLAYTMFGGSGGNSALGGGGVGQYNDLGQNGGKYGGGGGGASRAPSSGSQALGGTGGDGVVIVTEYII